MTKTGKRWNFIINLLYFAIIVAIVYVVVTKFFSILLPFIIALAVAMMLQRPVNALHKKTHIKRGPLSVVGVLVLCIVLAGVLVLIGFYAAGKIKGFVAFVGEQLNDLPKLLTEIEGFVVGIVEKLPDRISTTAVQTVRDFFASLMQSEVGAEAAAGFDITSFDWSSLLSKGGDILIGTVGQVPSFLIACVITVIASIFVTSDYDRIRSFILRQLSDDGCSKIIRAKQLCVSTVLKMVKAYGLIFLITTCELTLALYILKGIGVLETDYIVVIAALIAFVDIIPVLGTGTVLIPWAVISLLSGKIGLAIGLLVTYAVILVIRQVLEPKLVSGQTGLPPIVTIVSMYIGTKTLGVLGFFILPFIVILIAELNKAGVVHIFKGMEDVSDAPPASAPPAETAAEALDTPPAPDTK